MDFYCQSDSVRIKSLPCNRGFRVYRVYEVYRVYRVYGVFGFIVFRLIRTDSGVSSLRSKFFACLRVAGLGFTSLGASGALIYLADMLQTSIATNDVAKALHQNKSPLKSSAEHCKHVGQRLRTFASNLFP